MSKKTNPPSLAEPGEGVPETDKRSPAEREAQRQEQVMIDLIHRTKLDSGTVSLKRRAFGETRFGFIGEIPAGEFSEDNVCKLFGGGDYQAQFLTAAKKFMGHADFKIDYSIPSKYPGVSREQQPDRTADVVQAVAAAVKSSLPAPAPTQESPLLLQMIKQQGDLTLAMLQRPAGPDPAVAALTELMREFRAELKELRTQQNAPRGDSFFSELKKYQALSELIGGGGSGDAPVAEKPDRFTTVVQALAPALAPIVARMITPAGVAPAPEQLALMENAHAGTGAAAGATSNPQDTMTILFAPYLAEFRRVAVLAASKNRDPFEWADAKLDDIDPKYHAKIFEMAQAEDWFAKFFGIDAGAQNHVAWLQKMRNAILTRAFVLEVATAARAVPPPTPEVLAKRLLEKISPSWEDTLWDLTDAEAWKAAFAASGIESQVWLEQLRAAFENEMSDHDEAAAPEPTPAPPAPAAGAKPEKKAARGKARKNAT